METPTPEGLLVDSQAVEGPVAMMDNLKKPVAHIATGSTIANHGIEADGMPAKAKNAQKQSLFDLNLHIRLLPSVRQIPPTLTGSAQYFIVTASDKTRTTKEGLNRHNQESVAQFSAPWSDKQRVKKSPRCPLRPRQSRYWMTGRGASGHGA